MERRNKRSKSKKFSITIRFVILASLALSITTLFFSWGAFHKDHARLDLHGNILVQLERSVITNDEPHFSQKAQGHVGETNSQRTTDAELRHELSSTLLAKQNLQVEASQSKMRNSEIYQPDRTAGRRLLTYKRFGGRLNNQLFQFITALQHAKVLKRTLVVPDEVREVDWTGMFDTGFGIWDLEKLNAVYDIDWTSGLSSNFIVPDHCLLHWKEAPKLLEGGPKHWEEWDSKCPDVIDIAGNTGLLFCKRQHQFCGDAEAQTEAYKIYSHLNLSREMLQFIPSKVKGFKNQGYDELAIHSRRAGEGGYDWELCIKGNRRTCINHLDSNIAEKFCDIRTMKGNCAIWMDLEYQIKSKNALKKTESDYKFVLASDGTHDWSIDFEGQFVVANNTEWLQKLDQQVNDRAKLSGSLDSTMTVSSFAKKKLGEKKTLSDISGTLNALTSTLLDLFSLVDSKYLLGSYYSTLSLNACYFRGLERMYDSNMCWMLMHINTEAAIPPPLESTVHASENEKNDLPPALMSDVEHAFIHSQDGNFIVIDRYLIPYQKPGFYKYKNVIGVLGDGLVPLTIKKDDGGKEIIQADFTCSMGNEHNTKATVILMKGHQSYNEHYYSNGEKYKSPFSTNGDRFRTMVILCEELTHDKSLSRHPPLILKSNNSDFYVSIGSSFARPINKPVSKRSISEGISSQKELVHCLNPVYGLKDPRWIIEYIEYHRAIGVSHIHLYNIDLHSPDIQAVLEIYREQNFITRHDWSGKVSGAYTTRVTYEHAKWAAQTDCVLRSRGQYDYALFSDIDEVAVGNSASPKSNYQEGHLAPALDACAASKAAGKIGCSFNSNTVTSVYTKLDDEEETLMKEKLILERYKNIEKYPHCPANCYCLERNCTKMTRAFHQGRQKYIFDVRDLDLEPRPMWTHAISRDYNEMNEIMDILPDEVMHVRHYQGHWYLNRNLLNIVEEKEAPLSEIALDTVRSAISSNEKLSVIYSKAIEVASNHGRLGVEWITPLERPSNYHPSSSK